MNSEIKAIILDLGNYASNDKPQIDEHNVIIPYSLHYIDANLLFDYICELEEENEKLKETNKNLIFLKDDYSKSLNKASRFIVKNAIASDEWEEIEPLEFIPVGNITYKSLGKNKVQELDKILKGE